MTNLEYFFTKRLKSIINIDLKETERKHIFVADYLTFNLQERRVYIDYNERFTFYLFESYLYLYSYKRDKYDTYTAKYPEIQAHATRTELMIHPKPDTYKDTSIIDEEKASKLELTRETYLLEYLLTEAIDKILNTDFNKIKITECEDNKVRWSIDTELKEHEHKDEKTQLVIDAEQMLITIGNAKYTFTLDNYYMYIYNASQHYEKFLKYSDIVVYKPTCSVLVLSKVRN